MSCSKGDALAFPIFEVTASCTAEYATATGNFTASKRKVFGAQRLWVLAAVSAKFV